MNQLQSPLPFMDSETPLYHCVFSPCRTFRYTLIDEWDATKGRVMFTGLNPSTADEFKLDPTLKRIREWVKRWGYGSFVMTNLFGFRSPHPTVMEAQEDPVGPDNDRWLRECAASANLIVAAWGNGGNYRNRADLVVNMIREEMCISMECLGVTNSGAPIHPMARGRNRIPDDVELQPFA